VSGEIDQLCFMGEFDGKVPGKVGLGDALGSVYENLGKCTIDHWVHEPRAHR